MMSDDILSQDEIDALLGRSTSTPRGQRDEPRTGKSDMSAIGEILRVAMEKTATAFGIMTGGEGKASLNELASGALRQFHPALEEPAFLVECEFQGGLHGIVLSLVPLHAAQAMAALARGEDPRVAGGDDLTGFRDAAVEMAGHLADALSAALGRELHVDASEPARVAWERLEAPPVPVGLDEEVVYAGYTLMVGDTTFRVNHLIPADVAALIASGLGEGEDGGRRELAAAAEPAASSASDRVQGMRQQNGGMKGRTNGGTQIATAQFAELASPKESSYGGNIDLLLDVPLEVTVELGRTRMQIREILELGKGSIVELEKVAGEPVEIYVNGKLIARGEVVTIDENFGVKITDIVSRRDRVTSFR